MRPLPVMSDRSGGFYGALVGLVLLLAESTAVGGQGGLTPEAVAQQLADRFGVEVLRVVEAEDDGRRVYIATVVNPGGDSNGAFQVNRLMVDPLTGTLISQFRHGAAGYQLPGGGMPLDNADGRMIRRQSLPSPAGPTGE